MHHPHHSLGVNYFLCSLALVLTLLFAIDQFVIPFLEDQGKLVSQSWEEENDFLYYSMHARNKANFKTNPIWRSAGFPVSDASKKSHRILVLGDSFAWGHGYANMNDIWWRQLSRELTRRGYNDVEVIAAGMQGINTRFELDIARRVIPKLKPDIVIWGFIPNDADELSAMTADDLDQKAVFRPHRSNRLEQALKGVFPDLAYQLFQIRNANLRLARSGDAAEENPPLWEYSLLTGKNWDAYRDTVKEVADYLHSLQIPAFFLALPYECPGAKLDYQRIQDHYNRIMPPVKSEYERHNVRFIDSFDQWLSAARNEKSLSERGILSFGINPANAHPNTWATHAYASTAADILEKDYAQCLGEKAKPRTVRDLHVNDWLPANMFLREGGRTIVFSYPFKSDDLCYMPLRKPHVLLSFEHPVNIRTIKLGGKALNQADIAITHEDSQKGYDDGVIFKLASKKGSWLSWDIPTFKQQGINTLRISASVKGLDRALLLELK